MRIYIRFLGMFFVVFLMLFAMSACGENTEFLDPEPTSSSTKVPTSTPLPAPSPAKEPISIDPGPAMDFSEISDFLAAYADDYNDRSGTSHEARKIIADPGSAPPNFPRISPALFDLKGNLLITFGGGPAFLIDNLAVTSSAVNLTPAPDIYRRFNPQELREMFPYPAGYDTLSLQEKVDTLLDLIAAKTWEKFLPLEFDSLAPKKQVEAMLGLFLNEDGKKLFPTDFESLESAKQLEAMYNALPNKIWHDNFPSKTIPLELQIKVLGEEYFQIMVVRGVILEFGQRPDGSADYEIIQRSTARDANFVLEIFQRKPNPVHPFPDSLPFEIQELGSAENPQLNPLDRLIFYGHRRVLNGEFSQIMKSASVASIDHDRSIFAMNGSVVSGDIGAPVFSLKCGIERLAGIVAGSFKNTGRETETYVIGIRRIIEFIEENTDVIVRVKESTEFCPQADPAIKERLIDAISDGLYDSSYDIADLKNTDSKDIMSWVRPFRSMWISNEDPDRMGIMAFGQALILEEGYVAVIASAVSSTTRAGAAIQKSAEQPSYEVNRIFWGSADDHIGGEQNTYEDLEFIGVDSTNRVVLFKRPKDSAFPMPQGMPFSIGRSSELRAGNVLYTIGAADFKVFARSTSPILHQASDPASVIGFLPGDENIFYVESSGRKEDTGGPVFALRDGAWELVGFIYSLMKEREAETLNSALTAEFVFGAIEEIKCENRLSSCEKSQDELGIDKAHIRTPRAEHARNQITSLLKDRSPYFMFLLFDILNVDVSVVSQYEIDIVSATFVVDESGEIVDDGIVTSAKATLLPAGYVLTIASLVQPVLTLEEAGLTPDISDISSSTILSGVDQKIELRAAITRKPLSENETLYLLKSSPSITETDEAEILDVVIIDRENGYALFKRRTAKTDGETLGVVALDDIQVNQEILLSYSQSFITPRRIAVAGLVSGGSVLYPADGKGLLIINGFVSKDNLGAPIFSNCGGKICLMAIVHRTHHASDQIQTEGIGLSIDFIFGKIKEKTGIDFYPKDLEDQDSDQDPKE